MTHQSERSIVVQDGFSVVEALIAAALIGLAFLAISTLFPTGYSNITYGGRVTTAVAHAQQKIEQLKAIAADTTPGQGFNAIDATNCSVIPVTLADPLVPTITFSRTCTLTPNVGMATPPPDLRPDLKKVRVTVTWDAQNRPGSVDVEALFTR
ncbi:MAG: hypothetical protein EWM72_03438 [Nitrospira sp.]|nr:MAG: hypothetical protein EWM72_03438 [Nitrospira sp.]